MEVYWRTLCMDQMPDGYETAKSQFHEWFNSLSPIRRLIKMKMDWATSIFKPLGFLGYLHATWTKYPDFVTSVTHLTLRRIAKTKGGYLCLVPASTKPGDEIWLFQGGKVPMVVREGVYEHWELVGDAFVHGIMDGQAFDDTRCRDLLLK